MEAWETTARLKVLEAIAKYAQYVDQGRRSDVATLFSPDGVLEASGIEPARGHDEIEKFLAARTQNFTAREAKFVRHYVTGTVFETLTPEQIQTSSYFLVVTNAGLTKCGRYRDVLIRHGHEWLFQHRYVRGDVDFGSINP